MNDLPEINKEEEDSKDDIVQFETTMVLNSIESFKNKKITEIKKQDKHQYFDLMSIFQFNLYRNPQKPIQIPESEFVPKSLDKTSFKLDNKM